MWWQVDPLAEIQPSISPYCAMNNNPILYNDPDGDIAPLVWAGIAAAGGAFNVWRNWDNINGFGDGLAAFGIGATAAVVGTAAAPAAATGGSFLASVGSYAAAGTVGGGVGGAIEGFGNGVYFGDGFGDGIRQGITDGFYGAAGGFVLGSLTGAGAHWLRQGKTPTPGTSTSSGDDVLQNFVNDHSVHTKGGHNLRGSSITQGIDLDEYVVTATRPGSFNVSNWSGYPSGLSRPTGPFRLLHGDELKNARNLANRTNASLRKKWDLIGKPYDIHEIHPVKFGGSPTDLANKAILPRGFHQKNVSPWWRKLQRILEKKP